MPPIPKAEMHICSFCHEAQFRHEERCILGCFHYPALCCPECYCRSFRWGHFSTNLISFGDQIRLLRKAGFDVA